MKNNYFCDKCKQEIKNYEDLGIKEPENGNQASILGINEKGEVIAGYIYYHKECGHVVIPQEKSINIQERICGECGDILKPSQYAAKQCDGGKTNERFVCRNYPACSKSEKEI